MVVNEQRQVEAAKDREELLKKIEENKQHEQQQADKRWQKDKSHQNDLLGQMDYNRRTMMKVWIEEVEVLAVLDM